MHTLRDNPWIRRLSVALFAGALLVAGPASAQDIFGFPLPTVEQGPDGITITLRPETLRGLLGAAPSFDPQAPSFDPQAPSFDRPAPPPGLPGAAAPVPAAPEVPVLPEAAPAVPSSGGRLFGVFVGISDYPDANDLRFCADDARRVQRAFLEAGLMAPTDTVVLTDASATRANVGGAIERFARAAGPGDTLVFFFSGHGSQVADRDGDEADGQDEAIVLVDGAVTDDELREALGEGAGRDFVALDSCYSGGFAQDLARLSNSVGFYASAEDQVSYVAEELQAGGYLSYYLAQNIVRMGRRPIPMWELQRDIAADFEQSGAARRQQLTVNVSRGVNTRTVLFDGSGAVGATRVAAL